MEKQIKTLIAELKAENSLRTIKMNSNPSEYEHSVYLHQYNITLDFIKRLENILKQQQ